MGHDMRPETLRGLLDDVGYSEQIVAKPPRARLLSDDLNAAADAWETQNDNNEKVKEALRTRLEAAEFDLGVYEAAYTGLSERLEAAEKENATYRDFLTKMQEVRIYGSATTGVIPHDGEGR